MSNGDPLSLSELEQRIAIVRDNIRQLIEQAAAFSAPGMKRATPTVWRNKTKSSNG